MIIEPVVPIPPSYTENGDHIDYEEIKRYIQWLKTQAIATIMTTAGTTQFNLLTKKEIWEINVTCLKQFNRKVIIGIPPLNIQETLEEIEKVQPVCNKNSCIMVMYPDRYYDDSTIVKFFHTIANYSPVPILIHGMFMQKGTGGIYNYTSSLLNKIFAHDNIVGMKEESTTFNVAYEVCSNIDTHNKFIIVAGGSMRRFNALLPTGVRSFLSGIGNFWPQLELRYAELIKDDELLTANYVITNYEDPIFNVFMSIGWHPSLRYALKHLNLCCTHDRQPFPQLNVYQKEQIEQALYGANVCTS